MKQPIHAGARLWLLFAIAAGVAALIHPAAAHSLAELESQLQ